MVRQWKRLPRGVVAAPSLEIFQSRLNGALNNLIAECVPVHGKTG